MSSIKHVAIIMDGNGRWANQRRRPRVWGHVRGSFRVSEIVEYSSNRGIKFLTLYAFSSENWSRPEGEIKILFKLLEKFIKKETDRILKNNIKFRTIGRRDNVPEYLLKLIIDLEEKTKNNSGLNLNFAFNYGGRQELLDCFNRMQQSVKNNFCEKDIIANLYEPDLANVDLMIRTGGDCRVSNFLLWQLAYAELFFAKTPWPDFSVEEFESILDSVEKRDRRFGSVKEDSYSVESRSSLV